MKKLVSIFLIFAILTVGIPSSIVQATQVVTKQIIGSGNQVSAVIKADGSLWTWGWNRNGMLGNGQANDLKTTIPTKIMDNISSVSLKAQHGAAIKEDGSLWTWGWNRNGELGNGTTTDSSVPIKIMDNVLDVSVSYPCTAAIKTDGSLWTWGWNRNGILGDGTSNNSSVPIKIMDNVNSIKLGYYHSSAIKTDGSLWTWGENVYGVLGNGTTNNSFIPIKVMEDVAAVNSGDYHIAVIKSDASLWMWGRNNHGQLGDGTRKDSYLPIKIMDDVVSVSLGSSHSSAIKTDGSLWVWGRNGNGELGNSTTVDSINPIKIMDDVVSVSLGSGHSVAIKTDGSLWTWGYNGEGQLGNGTTTNSSTPIKIMDNVMLPSNNQGENDNTTNDDVFDVNKYRADYILNSNWEETIEDTYFDFNKMPAHTLKAAAEENNNDIWIDAWNTFTKTIDAVDDASKTLDYVFEEKDMYQAIIFELFESSVDYRIMDCINNDITKNTKNIVDIVTADMESIYNYDFLKNTDISSMTTAQKDNLISSMKKAFKKEHGNAADVSKIADVIGKGIDYAEDFQSYCEMIDTCYNVIHLSDSMKQIMLDMYKKCPLDNMPLKSALFECVNIMNSSEDAFVYKMSAYFYGVVGKNVAQVAVDKMWKEVKAQVYVSCPEAYVLMAAYKTGKYISNVVFGTDEIAEKYCNVVALVQTEDLLKSVYNDTKSKYLSNKTSANAATYNSSIDIMFNALDVDCNYANKYATAIDSGLAGKLYAALGMSSTEEFSQSVASIQDICYNVHESILTGWVYELENDYPSLYNEYSHLLDKSWARIKKRYNIACPVDVYVYNSENELIASVVNNKIYCIDDNITISVDGDEKSIYFYDNKEYNIVYVGNDEGTMDISVTEYDDNEADIRNVYFNNLELSNGLTYTATESGTSNDDSQYVIIDENQNSIDADYDTQVTSDADIYTASIKNGYFDNDGATVCKELHSGERAVITAFVPKGYEFDGWVSDCAEVIFEDKNSATTNIYMPECDVNITANLIKCPTLSIEEITNTTLSFKAVNCDDITEGTVILAIYNEDGSLNCVKTKDFTDELTFNDLKLTNGKAKVMLWDNLDSLTPLTKATEKIFFFETLGTK